MPIAQPNDLPKQKKPPSVAVETALEKPIIRRAVSQGIAQRVKAFTSDTVQNHPVTVAQLVKSSIPTQHLLTIGNHLEEAWQYVQQKSYAETAAKYGAMAGASPLGQRDMAPASLDSTSAMADVPPQVMAAMQRFTTNQPLNELDKKALNDYAGTDNPALVYDILAGNELGTTPGSVQVVGSPFMVVPGPVAAAGLGYLMAGSQIADKLHVHALGVPAHIVNVGLQVGVRGLETLPAAAIETVSQIEGHDTHWKDTLTFWDTSHHDPATIAAFDVTGKDINDPKNANEAKAMDFLLQFVGIVAGARIVGAVGEMAKTPGEVGGFFASDSPIGRFMVNKSVGKMATIIDESKTREQAIGNILSASDNIDPFLAERVVDAYKTGGRGEVHRAIEEYANEANVGPRIAALREQRAAADRQIQDASPEQNTAELEAQRLALDRHIEALSNKQVQARWPKVASVRGVLKGAPATSWVSKVVDAIYNRDSASGFDVTKITDNMRSRPTWWDPTDPNRPADFAERTADAVGKTMRAAGIDYDTIAQRLGEYTDIKSYSDYFEWRNRIADDIASMARGNVPPEVLDEVTHSLRNPEAARSRSEFTDSVERNGRPVTFQRKVLEGEKGQPLPSRETQFASSAPGPDMARIKDVSSWVRSAERTKGIRLASDFLKDTNRLATGITKPLIVALKPKIMLAIQFNQAMISALLGVHPLNAVPRIVAAMQDRGIVVIPGGVPVDIGAIASGAERFFPSITSAREASAAMSGVDPREIGQVLVDIGTEPSTRQPIPIGDFKDRFARGETTPEENTAVGNDLHWELSDMHAARSFRSLATDGVDATVSRMVDRADTVSLTGKEARALLEKPTKEYPTAAGHVPTPGNPVLEYDPISGKGLISEGRHRTEALGSTDTADYEVRYVDTATIERDGSLAPGRPAQVLDPAMRAKLMGRSPELADYYIRDLKPQIDKAYGRDTGIAELKQTMLDNERLLDEVTGHDPSLRKAVGTGKWDVPPGSSPAQRELAINADAISQLGDAKTGSRIMDLEVNSEILRLHDFVPSEAPAVKSIDLADRQAVVDTLLNRAFTGEYDLPSRVYRETPNSVLTGMDTFTSREGLLGKYQQLVYKSMRYWTKADIAGTRGGLWEQMYTKWHDRFVEAGISETRAGAAAQARANFEVREWLHDVGNRSSMQQALRNDFPFMHAWQKVLWQWFYKVPEYIGGGLGAPSAVLGFAMEEKMLEDLKGLLRTTGVMQKVTDPDGTKRDVLVIPNPVRLLDWFPGLHHVTNSVIVNDPEHLFIPTRVLGGEIPALAPQLQFLLNEAAKANIPVLKKLNDIFTKDGTFQPEFPGFGQVTNLIEATTGKAPPWLVGQSKRYQQYTIDRTKDGALRYAFTELAGQGIYPPNPADYVDNRAGYVQARDDYWARANAVSNEYFHGLMWTHLYSTTGSILSITPTSKEEQAWKTFLKENGIEGERTPEDYALIDKYLAAHPGSLAFNVSMYGRDSKWPTDPSLAAFKEGIGNGSITWKNYPQYRSAVALSQEWSYYDEQKRQLLDQAGLSNWDKMSENDKLRNWGKYLDAIGPAWDNFQEFLKGDPGASKYYDSTASATTLAYDKVNEIEANRRLLEQDGKNPDAMEQKIFDDLAAKTGYGTTPAEHMAWYKAVPYHEYISKTIAIYDKIDAIKLSRDPNTSAELSAQYAKLLAINNSYSGGVKAPGGAQPGSSVTYLSPEEYSFTKRSPDDQQAKVVEWAQFPPAWLSDFQRTTVYGLKPTAKTAKYSTLETRIQSMFDSATKNLSHSSNEYAGLVAWRENALTSVANQIGGDATKIRKLEKDIPVGRMQAAGVLPDNPYMGWIVDNARVVAQRILGQGLTVTGTSQFAEQQRGYIEGVIDGMRDPKSDYYSQAVDHFFRQQIAATGITDAHALYREILWGVPAGFYLPLDFTYENETARKVG